MIGEGVFGRGGSDVVMEGGVGVEMFGKIGMFVGSMMGGVG